MKRLGLPLLALMVIGVAACEGRDPVADEANAVAEPAAAAPAEPAVADNAASELDANGVAAAPSAAIPPRLHGRWALTPADCTTTRGDAKGLMVIDAAGLRFYESRAVPGTSIETTPTSISGNFDFTGEGQSWSRYQSLKLRDDLLIRTERNPVASYSYAKCD